MRTVEKGPSLAIKDAGRILIDEKPRRWFANPDDFSLAVGITLRKSS